MKKVLSFLLVILTIQLHIYSQELHSFPIFKGNLHEYLSYTIRSSVKSKIYTPGDRNVFTNVHFRIDRRGIIDSVSFIPAVDSVFADLLTRVIKSTSLKWDMQISTDYIKRPSILMILPVLFQLPPGPSGSATAAELLTQIPSLKDEPLEGMQLQYPKKIINPPQLCVLLSLFEYRFIN